MKVAIVTIHRANNYGAVLQAFATQQVLSKVAEVEMIDYDNRFLFYKLDLFRFSFSMQGLKMFIHDILRFSSRYKAINKFNRFISSFMNLSKKLTREELLNGKANSYDIYICGSDQIWNSEIVTKDKTLDPIFFLKFAPKGSKKISYASSIGHHIFSDKEEYEVKSFLSDFSMISLREKDGYESISKLLPSHNVQHVLDPTLLITKDEWLDIFNIKQQKSKERYILLYTAPRSRLLKDAVKYFSKEFGLKVISIDQAFFPLSDVDIHIKDAGPKEFIEYFNNAEFIITDSFHGLCFSINFNIPFVAISPGKKSNRLESLVNLLNLEKRLVASSSEFINIKKEIYSEKISLNLQKEREISKTLLLDQINL